MGAPVRFWGAGRQGNLSPWPDSECQPGKCAMSGIAAPPRTEKTTRKHCKVILLKDDFTPCDVGVEVLKDIFRITASEALGVMSTAHRRGASVVAVLPAKSGKQGAARHQCGPVGGLSPDLRHRARRPGKPGKCSSPRLVGHIRRHVPRVPACRCMARVRTTFKRSGLVASLQSVRLF